MRRSTLAFLFEGQFALLVVILVLSTTSIFTTLDMSQLDYSAFRADCQLVRDWKEPLTFPLFLGILSSSGCLNWPKVFLSWSRLLVGQRRSDSCDLQDVCKLVGCGA